MRLRWIDLGFAQTPIPDFHKMLAVSSIALPGHLLFEHQGDRAGRLCTTSA
jgi:hypothetical protein